MPFMRIDTANLCRCPGCGKQRIARPRTPRHRQICQFIQAFQRQRHVSPTFDEIATALSVRKSVIYRQIETMAADGVLSFGRRKPRSITLAEGLELGEAGGVNDPVL